MQQQSTLLPNKTIKIYIVSLILFLYIFISFVPFGTIIVLSFWGPFKFRYWLAQQWVASVLWVAKVFCGITHQVEGLERLPKDRPAVVLCKHQSAWETIALRLILPTQTTVLKRSLLWIPFGGWALTTLRPIAINRENQKQALKLLLDQGTKALHEGLWVVVFPEGTRTAVGTKTKFNGGGAMLGHKAGYPVIPIALNAGIVWPRYSFLKYPGVIKVIIGPAIDTTGKIAKEINAEAEAWIDNAMATIND